MTRRILAVLALAALAVPGLAAAKPQGVWDAVTAGGEQSSVSQIGVARTGDGVLHVAWQRRTGPNSYDLLHTAIDGSGRVGRPTPIVTGWVGIQDAALVTYTGQVPVPGVITAGPHLNAWFTGQRTTDTSDPMVGLLLADSFDQGGTWSGPTPIFDDANVHGRTPSVTWVANRHFAAWYDVGDTVVLRMELPPAPTGPVGGPVQHYDPQGSDRCCSYEQNIAGFQSDVLGAPRVVVAWCSGIDAPNGLWVQDVNPDSGAPVGAAALLPGSTATVDGKPTRVCDAAGRVPLVARPDGRFYAADSTGYPSATQVKLWRIGGGSSTVAAGDGEKRTVALAVASDGRLWIAWSRRGSNQLYFRRSNRGATVLGAVVAVRQPRRQVEASELDIAAQDDRLDVLGRFAALSGVTLFHSQVYPGLTLVARGGDRATFRVTDAGDPVAGATIRVAGRTLTTGAGGTASADLPPGTHRATAARAGYTGATASVRSR
jgi:hypothetical protein